MFGSYDYINWRLTGRRGVEQNWALEAGLVDLADHAIHDDLVALTHLARDAFPAKHVSHGVFGKVTAAAAAETGLPEGLPVFGGAADHIASALAAGLVNPGDVLLKFGGAGDIVVASDVARPDWRLFLDYHLVPGLYAPNGCMAASGSALNWLAAAAPARRARRQPAPRLRPARRRGRRRAATACSACPISSARRRRFRIPLARGTFTGLSLGHTPAHLWRALLEAVAFGFRHHVEMLARNRLRDRGGSSPPTAVRAAASGCRSSPTCCRRRCADRQCAWFGDRRGFCRRGRLGRSGELGGRGTPRPARRDDSARSGQRRRLRSRLSRISRALRRTAAAIPDARFMSVGIHEPFMQNVFG